MVMQIGNLVRVASATVGTGTLTLGSAISGFLTFAQAGIVSGSIVPYAIEGTFVSDNATAREIGYGTYNSAGPTLTRNVLFSTNSNALVNFTGDQHVILYPHAGLWPIGQQPIWVPAGAMLPRSSNGCAALATVEVTNKVNLKSLDFDPGTPEYAQFNIRMPKQWDVGTLTAQFVWKHAAVATPWTVVWGIQCLGFGNDDAADVAFPTIVTVNDAGGTTNDIYISDPTAAITIGNSVAENDLVYFQVSRDATNGSDGMALDAGLLGVFLLWSNDMGSDT